jgi:hypothetical protein
MPEIAHQRGPGNLRNRPRHFHPCRAGAHHHKSHRRLAHGGIGRLFRHLKSRQHPAANLQRIIEALQARRHLLPLLMPEIRVPRARRHNQVIVRNLPVCRHNPFRRHINPSGLSQHHLGIRLLAQNPPQRLGNIRRGQGRRRHLVKQRLKEMMILPVEQRDPHPGLPQSLRRRQPAKAPANNDHMGQIPLMNSHSRTQGKQILPGTETSKRSSEPRGPHRAERK